jgi:hydroxymethylpyrimidine/phosphomethylpyrimidine kinase
MKTVLIIAGSDPGAGAGLQQDLKVITLLGPMASRWSRPSPSRTARVRAVHPVAPEVVAAQLEAVLSDFPVAAVKVGMLATPAIVRTVAERLKALDGIPLVLDPVLAAGGGSRCSRQTASQADRRAVPPDLSSDPQRPGSRPYIRD